MKYFIKNSEGRYLTYNLRQGKYYFVDGNAMAYYWDESTCRKIMELYPDTTLEPYKVINN